VKSEARSKDDKIIDLLEVYSPTVLICNWTS